MPRITALHMLRSTMKTVSAPASSSFRGSLPHPTHPLCTLRVRRHRRLTQHSLPGGLLDLTWAGLAPADRASLAWRLLSFDHLIGENCDDGGLCLRLPSACVEWAELGGRIAQCVRMPKPVTPHQCPPAVSPVSPCSVRYCIV